MLSGNTKKAVVRWLEIEKVEKEFMEANPLATLKMFLETIDMKPQTYHRLRSKVRMLRELGKIDV